MASEKTVPIQMLFQNGCAHCVKQQNNDIPIILLKIPICERQGFSTCFRAEFLQNGIGQIDKAVMVVRINGQFLFQFHFASLLSEKSDCVLLAISGTFYSFLRIRIRLLLYFRAEEGSC